MLIYRHFFGNSAAGALQVDWFWVPYKSKISKWKLQSWYFSSRKNRFLVFCGFFFFVFVFVLAIKNIFSGFGYILHLWEIMPLQLGRWNSSATQYVVASSFHVFFPWCSDLANGITMCMHAKSLQSCLTLCNPMNCSPPGSSVHRSLQGRILEWIAMASSRGSS